MGNRAGALRYYLKKFYAAKTDHEAMDIVVDRLYPLLQGLWPERHAAWINECSHYFAKRDQLYVAALHELKQTISDLWRDLGQMHLLDIPVVKQQLCRLDAMLTSRKLEPNSLCPDCGREEEYHRPYVLPSDLYGLAEGIKWLCVTLLRRGQWQVLVKYARIISIPKRYDEISGPLEIYSYEFAPSYFKLMEFDRTPQWHRREDVSIPAWVAWDTIFCLWWVINKSREFLKKKRLNYSSIDQRVLSAERLYLHGLKVAVNAVKKKKQQKYKTYLCSRETIKNALYVLLRDLAVPYDDAKRLYEQTFPESLELYLFDHFHLRLQVEWTLGVIEEFHLHSFHDSQTNANGHEIDYENERLEFIEALLTHPGTVQRASVDYANAAQYLCKMGLKDVLGDLFIGHSDRNAAMLRSRRIVVKDMPQIVLKKLLKKLDRLEHAGWVIKSDNTFQC